MVRKPDSGCFSKIARSAPRLHKAARHVVEHAPRSVSGRRLADDLGEGATERSQARESDVHADLGDAVDVVRSRYIARSTRRRCRYRCGVSPNVVLNVRMKCACETQRSPRARRCRGRSGSRDPSRRGRATSAGSSPRDPSSRASVPPECRGEVGDRLIRRDHLDRRHAHRRGRFQVDAEVVEEHALVGLDVRAARRRSRRSAARACARRACCSRRSRRSAP